jgi:hypothetical protein
LCLQIFKVDMSLVELPDRISQDSSRDDFMLTLGLSLATIKALPPQSKLTLKLST